MSKLRWVLVLGNLVIAAVIGLCIGLPLSSTAHRKPNTKVSKAVPVLLELRNITPPDLGRSLFESTRDESSRSDTQESAIAPELRLAGVLIADDLHIALVEQQDSALQRVSEGDEIGGWIVTDIQARSITLKGPDQVIVYPLDPPSEDQ